MRQYHTELRETKELEKIICNKCGKEIVVTRGIPQEDVLDIEKQWGYFSEKDGVVFSKDGTKLIVFPSGRSGDYQIPDGTVIRISDILYAPVPSPLRSQTQR